MAVMTVCVSHSNTALHNLGVLVLHNNAIGYVNSAWNMSWPRCCCPRWVGSSITHQRRQTDGWTDSRPMQAHLCFLLVKASVIMPSVF